MGIPTILYRLLALAALLVLANGILTSKRRAIDCRRYVFAPVCRGVAAKRAIQDTTNFDDVISPADMEEAIIKEALLARSQVSREVDPVSERLARELLERLMEEPELSSSSNWYPHKSDENEGLLRFLLSTEPRLEASTA